jgi:putative membrane protein
MTEPPEAKAPMDSGTRLGYHRTYLAHERTQLAWVRTSLALIAFGFGIAQFYQYLHETQGERAPPMGPRTVGMLMISIGLVALASAYLQHRRAMRALRAECPDLPASTAGATAVVIMLLGILAFLSALL